jgi:hypothetical protein
MKSAPITAIIRSTVHIIMKHPEVQSPVGIGSGCIIDFEKFSALFSVAHVTDKNASTCISLGKPITKYGSPLFAISDMNYLAKFNLAFFKQQLEELKTKIKLPEEKDFGQIDLSFEKVPEGIEILQIPIHFEAAKIKIKAAKKIHINHSSVNEPSTNVEYAFFGRIKPTLAKGTLSGDLFETQEAFYGGVSFVKKIGNYYQFALSEPIADNADFKGTSGAPIMDSKGNVVSLITHGYEGGNLIYGIALPDFLIAAEKIMNDSNTNK